MTSKVQEVTNRLIFGRPYRITISSDSYAAPEIFKSFELYPLVECSQPAFEIEFRKNLDQERLPLACDPQLFERHEDSFTFDFGPVVTRFYPNFNGHGKIVACLRPVRRDFIGVLKRVRHMEFPTLFDHTVQIVHELVLIPSTYMHPDLGLVHASCIARNGKAALFCGTGGVGKSSALLHLAENKSYEFVSDDICAISLSGAVFPNFAWPKIYGYNFSIPSAKESVFKAIGLASKIHLRARLAVNMRVRRKVSPLALYDGLLADRARVSSVTFLKREKCTSPRIEEVSLASARDMGLSVMETEYTIFHRVLEWEKYNALAIRLSPFLTMDEVRKTWRAVYMSGLKNSSIKKISIPLSAQFVDFRDLIEEIANEL